MPTSRSELASTIVDGKIYVAGGINFWGSSDSFEVYDIEKNSWENSASLPESLNHVGIASANGKIYLSGGFFNMRQTDFSDVLYEFDIEKKVWIKLVEMPDSRAAHFMIERDGKLYLIGGRKFREIWAFDIEKKTLDKNALKPLPKKRDHISVLQDEKYLYVVGGRIGGEVQKDCWRYEFESNKWGTFAEIPQPRGGQTSMLANGKIHIIGGEDLGKGVTYNRHDVYDLEKKTWTTAEKLPTARHGLTSQVYKDKWFIIGGGESAGVRTIVSASNAVEIYQFTSTK